MTRRRFLRFVDCGAGDLGNDGVHRIDYARRGLEAGFAARGQKLPDWPMAVSASGGKYVFDDVQEWPDTLLVAWDYGPKGEPGPGSASVNAEHDLAHKRDFLAALKSRRRPSCDIEAGHAVSGLCHLGNIAWRVNRKLRFDAAAQSFTGDEEANRFLERSYRKPWDLPKV